MDVLEILDLLKVNLQYKLFHKIIIILIIVIGMQITSNQMLLGFLNLYCDEKFHNSMEEKMKDLSLL